LLYKRQSSIYYIANLILKYLLSFYIRATILMLFLSGCGAKKAIKNQPTRVVDGFEKYLNRNKDNKQIKYLPAECNKKKTEYSAALHNKVSVFIYENVDIKEALFAIAQQAGVNLVIDSDVHISKSIIYSASDKEVITVIKDICLMMNFDYEVVNNSIFISRDKAYLKSYSVAFLASQAT
jgi:hypothetical protein